MPPLLVPDSAIGATYLILGNFEPQLILSLADTNKKLVHLFF